MELGMSKVFYLVLLICILVTDSNLIRAIVYFVNDIADLQLALKFITFDSLESQVYTLLGKILIFIGVFISIALYKSKEIKSKQYGIWFSLTASFSYYWFTVWALWLPIANGERMNSTFAIAFIFITLYANIAGLVAGGIGYHLGKFLNKDMYK